MKDEFLKSIENKIKNTKADIFKLVKYNHVLNETIEIVNSNKHLAIKNYKDLNLPENHFFSYLLETYLDYATAGIRRHSRLNKANNKSSSRSLIYILNKLRCNHQKLNREYYVNKILLKYEENQTIHKHVLKHHADTLFDSLTSPNDRNFLCKNIVEQDIIKLQKITKPICDFVDKNVAHIEFNNSLEEISLSKILESIDLLANLTNKYLLFFKDQNLSYEKLHDESWKKCFEIPWVENV